MIILSTQLDDLAQGIGLEDPTELSNIASSLDLFTVQLSQGNGMNVGNLNASLTLIQTLAGVHVDFTELWASSDETQVINIDDNETSERGVQSNIYLLSSSHFTSLVSYSVSTAHDIGIGFEDPTEPRFYLNMAIDHY